MTTAIIDYGSGNLCSAAKAFERAAAESVLVTSRPEEVVTADRIVLPGVGAFADCRRGLAAVPGLEAALCEAVSKALGDRAGIQRYGNAVIPFDETLTRVSLDCSNRPYLVWKVNFSRPKLGEMDTELFKEWFQAFAQSAGVTLHIENIYGENNHHIVESCFKGLARALRQAIEIDPRRAGAVPSTKGTLGGSLT